MSAGAPSRWLSGLALSGLLTFAGCRSPSAGRAQASPAASSHRQAPLSADPDLAAAERAAIARLSEFRSVLESARPGTQGFEVQALVRDGALSERLWLFDVRAVVGGYEGSVISQPQIVKSTQRGQQLRVANEDVIDWAYYDRGKAQGGETRLVEVDPTVRTRSEAA